MLDCSTSPVSLSYQTTLYGTESLTCTFTVAFRNVTLLCAALSCAVQAVLTGPHSVHIRPYTSDTVAGGSASEGKTLSADHILIATGAEPFLPSPSVVPGIEHAITSDA